MPTYEYVCEKCDHTFERRQSFSDEPLKRCPECRGKVQRVINGGLGTFLMGSRSR
ncbi:MAG: zinc ribbon domain-containing protein, partial [Candidatus Brocadiia bacterium]|nr:zinc ribbon domain-containing protein [Candidatus Brocadiia bacterium]